MKSKIKKLISVAVVAACASAMIACAGTTQNKPNGGNGDSDITEQLPPIPTVTVPNGDMFTPADSDGTFATGNAVAITLKGNTAACSSPKVTVNKGNIKITADGTYVLSGAFSGGVTVDADKTAKVKLVLSGAQITNAGNAAIYVNQAAKVFVVLQGQNTLTANGKLDGTDGAIHSKDDLTVLGNGKLTVDCEDGKGIFCKNDVKFTGGDIKITADSHAIDANNSVRIKDATLTLTSGKDGVHCENKTETDKGYIYMESGTVKATAAGDGLDASNSVVIGGGTLDLTAGGGAGAYDSTTSTKGIKAEDDLKISGGTVEINSADDGIHCNGSVDITGGKITIKSGDDGIHADSSLIIENGTVAVEQSYEGLEAQNVTVTGGTVKVNAIDDGINAAGGKDVTPPPFGGRPQDGFASSAKAFIDIRGGSIYVNAGGDGVDANGNITVSGGTTIIEGPTDNRNGPFDYDASATAYGGVLVAVGSSGMAMNFSEATQGCILVNTGTQSAGTEIKIADGSNEVFSMTANKQYGSVLITSPKLVKGGRYTVSAGTYSAEIKLTTLIYGRSGAIRPMH